MRKLNILFLSCCLFSCDKPIKKLRYEVVAEYPHSTDCYTQGLEFWMGRQVETGGGYGSSIMREVDPQLGQSLRQRSFPERVFAEGLTVLNDELWMLTWLEHKVFVLNPETFELIRTHSYEGEGWGLTNDGTHLIMSNGSSSLKFLNPNDFSVVESLEVKEAGHSVDQLNELEYENGQIFANIYRSTRIVRISADDGRVTGSLDLTALKNQFPNLAPDEVLNGIAIHPKTGHLWVTGKRWPKMFELKILTD